MKCVVLGLSMLVSLSCFANGLQTNQAYLEEIKDVVIGSDEVSHQIVSNTDLVVKSEVDNNYELKAVSRTRWSDNAQMYDVRAASLSLNENGAVTATVIVVQVDGNSMGTDQTQVAMSCEKTAALISCQATLPNQNRLVLAIGR